MTDRDTTETDRDTTDGISRRRVLRRGAVATGVATFGTAAFSGTVAATDCPRTPGFWANHDWCEVLINPENPESPSVAEAIGIDDGSDPCPDGEYTLAGEDRTMSEWQEFLVSSPKGDKGVIMAKTLLATLLNNQRRSSDDPECTDKEVFFPELDEKTTALRVKTRAENWLEESSFPGTQQSWVVNGVDGEPLKDILDRYNNGTIEELDCDCTGEE